MIFKFWLTVIRRLTFNLKKNIVFQFLIFQLPAPNFFFKLNVQLEGTGHMCNLIKIKIKWLLTNKKKIIRKKS